MKKTQIIYIIIFIAIVLFVVYIVNPRMSISYTDNKKEGFYPRFNWDWYGLSNPYKSKFYSW